jgi:HPt (histidine-containing phosphotransfer) domain-containing protein
MSIAFHNPDKGEHNMSTPLPVIDDSVLDELGETAGEDFVAELVGTFFEEAPEMLAALRQALQAGNAESFRRNAHSLKTNAHTFGAMALGALARDLELGGLPADDRGLAALEAAYAQAAAALKERIGG